MNLKLLAFLNQKKRIFLPFLLKIIINENPSNRQELTRKDIQKILLIRPNHRLGNQILITPILIELSTIFPNCEIDLFLKGNLGKTIFENFTMVKNIIELPKRHFKYLIKYLGVWFFLRAKEYDLVINVVGNSSSGKLATKMARGKLKFYNL